MTVEEFAPAKINLALHVTGRRTDGYHLLDSLVVFADLGDRVTAAPGRGLSLVVDGPMAAGLDAGEDNLVLRAARFVGAGDVALRLTKVLPVASGIGGGSADAAAALRALSRLCGLPLPAPAAVAALGADVPVCLEGRACRMSGIGETLRPVPALPPAWLVLVNPGCAVPTPEVFARLRQRDNPPLPDPAPWPDAAALARWLGGCRNDLEPAATALFPVIGGVVATLAAQGGCLLARMSGSGATCLGLFADPAGAEAAARAIGGAHPSWWVRAARMTGQRTRSTT